VVSPVQELQDTFVLGMLVGDPVLCASVYAPNAVLVPPNREVIYGRRAIRDFWWRVIDDGGRGDAVVTETIETRGRDRIIERGRYTRFAEPVLLDRPIARGEYVVMLEPQPNGRWAWAADVWSDFVSAPSADRTR
jgi:hypothetical protein